VSFFFFFFGLILIYSDDFLFFAVGLVKFGSRLLGLRNVLCEPFVVRGYSRDSSFLALVVILFSLFFFHVTTSYDDIAVLLRYLLLDIPPMSVYAFYYTYTYSC
jgi:hypothetical protein